MRPFTALRAWLRRTDRFWDYLLGEPGRAPKLAARRLTEVVELEDRVVPDGRPYDFPVIAVGSGNNGADAVRVFDADTGAPLLNLYPFQEQFTGGVRVAVGDV